MNRNSGAATRVRWRRILLFYFAVYVLSYGSVGLFFLFGGSFSDPSWALFAQLSSLSSAITAIALSKLLWREATIDYLALKPRFDIWLLLAWVAALALALLALVLGLAVPGTSWDGTLQPAVDRTLLSSEHLDIIKGYAEGIGLPPVIVLLPMGLLLSFTMSLIAGCGEEFGWRGFVHTELRPLGFWRNVLITGLLWLGWHLPLLALGFGFPDHPGWGVLLMSAHILISSISLGYLRERSSTFAAGLFHGTTEAFILLALAPVAGGSDLTVGVASLSWIGADLLIALGFLCCGSCLARLKT
jgi:hypothetical protein